MDPSNDTHLTAAASSAPHKRPTARTWYTLLRGISFLLLLACLSLAIVAFVQPYRPSLNCYYASGVCDSGYYGYSYDSFPPIWQTVTIGLALPFFGYELFRSLFGDKVNLRSHLSLGLIISADVVLFLSFIGALSMGLTLSIWNYGIDLGLNFSLLAVAGFELAAMSFACRELRNRKHLKISHMNDYMREVDIKLQALTEAVARLEQHAGTSVSLPQTTQTPLTNPARSHNVQDSSSHLPTWTPPEMQHV